MNTAEQIRVAIIGCGLIGTEWDRLTLEDALPITHARAFSKHRLAKLVALCDIDIERARSASKYWHVDHIYTDPQQLFDQQKIDVAVIATPTSARWEVIEPALAARVKVLVIEKPLANSLKECRRLVAAIDAAGALTMVNFSRNWDPSMRELKEQIEAGAIGKVQRIVATYGKGISNNGSHLIDLASFLFRARPSRARALGSPFDSSEANWSPTGERAWDAQVEFIDTNGQCINLTLLGTDQNAFTCFEFKIIGHKAIFELSMGGRHLKFTELQEDPNFVGYVMPAPSLVLPSRYLESMQEMTYEALQLASGHITTSSCDVHTALRTALAVDAIQQSALVNGQWVAVDTL
jgi:predicted dehydrogenase